MRLILLFAVVCPLGLFAQGPVDGYMKGKGNLDIALSAGKQSAQEYIGAQGPFTYPRSFFIAGIFAAYGINDQHDVILNLPLVGNQLQDGSIYLRRQFLDKGNNRLMGAVGYSMPLSDYNTESALSIGQQAYQFHGKIIYQRQLKKGFAWQSQVGYNQNFMPVPSSYTASTKIIFTHKSWYFDFWGAYQEALTDVYYQGAKPYDTFRELGATYAQIGGVIYRGFGSKFGAFVNASQIVGGQGTYTTFASTGGIVIKL